MTSDRACEACGAYLPPDGATCAECGKVACWDCGNANGADQAFCRRCGVWLVGREPATVPPPATGPRPTPAVVTVLPASRPRVARPIQATPLRFERAPRRRGRWTVTTLAVILALAAVASVAALQLGSPESASPALAVLVSTADEPGAATAVPSAPIRQATAAPPTMAPLVTDGPPAGVDPTTITAASRPPVLKDGPVGERLTTPEPARSRTGWVCDDSVRLADAQSRRWVVDRVSFRAMGGYERIVLHLDQDGPASLTATAFGAPVASSSVRGSAQAATRPAVRRGIGVELSGGIRSGLELRGFRPQGLRTIRDLSLYRAGSTSRLFITVASDGCFRMRAPAWHAGASGGGATGQLIIDIRR